MERKQQKSPTLPESVVQTVLMFYQEMKLPISGVSRETGVSCPEIRKVLLSHGVVIRGRGEYTPHGADHPASKLTRELQESLEADLLSAHSHGPLAKAYGVSRERIRQIAERLGTPTGRQLQLLRRSKRKQAKLELSVQKAEKRRLERYEYYLPWREMWEAGTPIELIAEKLGLKSGSVSVRIVNLRKAFPDWFPLRRKKCEDSGGEVD